MIFVTAAAVLVFAAFFTVIFHFFLIDVPLIRTVIVAVPAFIPFIFVSSSLFSKTFATETSQKKKSQYRNLKKKIETIEKKLDGLENTWEDRYEAGKITRSQYRSLEKKIEAVEDYLDDLEDYLDEKFGYEVD